MAGKYRLTRVLGEGGMGVVYEAEHTRLGQRVALKMLLPELLRVEDLVKRFEREARAASQLRSRHTARVMDVDLTPDGVPYMVMELLEGRDLDAELERRKYLPLDEAVDYVLQACAAMDEAHALGIVHRDLKPSNVFLAEERGVRIAKILDFGISKVTSETDSKLTSAEAVMGTAMYMAPEQVRASRNVDARADIWSLGVVLYELISGRAPFQGSPTQVAAAIVTEDPPPIEALLPVPAAIGEALRKCLARDPAQRHPSVRDLMRAIAPFAPAGSQGAMTAQQVLGSSVHVSADLDRSSTGPRESPRTDGAWAQAAPSRGKATTIVGVASVIVALGLLVFIVGHFVGRSPDPKKPVATTAQPTQEPPRPTASTAPTTKVDVPPVPVLSASVASTPLPIVTSTPLATAAGGKPVAPKPAPSASAVQPTPSAVKPVGPATAAPPPTAVPLPTHDPSHL